MADEISEKIILLTVRAGSTDISIQIPMVDITDGFTPEIGLTPTDFDLVYARPHVAPVKDDCVALVSPAVDDPHLDYGCFEIDSTNMKGVYRFDIPDAPFAAGEENALLVIHHTSCRSVYIHVSLDTVEVETKTGFILAATGLDSVSFAEPSAYPTNIREGLMFAIMQVVNKVTQTATQKKTYQDDSSTLVLTQTLSDDDTTQAQSKGV